jgi:hypothetical protein
MQFLQTVSTTFSNTLGVGAFVGLFSTTFNQTFLFQAVAAVFGYTIGVSAFVGLLRTIFSNGTFGVVTVLLFLRPATGEGLAELNGIGFDLWDRLFSGRQGKGTGSEDRQQHGSEYLAFHDRLLLGRAIKWVRG